MRRRRRNNLTEINLTPLLDVLFSILFIVMMTGARTLDSEREDHASRVEALEEETARLEEEIARRDEQLASYMAHESDSVIITARNSTGSGNHILYLYRGTDETDIGSIQMGVDKTENTRLRIRGIIEDVIKETDNQPVYIIFYCDKKLIYTKEYNSVVKTFEELQMENKEVFFKVSEVE